MSRIVLVAFVFLLLVLVAGTLALGAFPPSPRMEQIQRVLPNDRFQPR